MSKSAAKPPPDAPQPGLPKPATKVKVRINLRAALVLGVLAVAAVPAYFAIRVVQDSRGKAAVLKQAREYLDAKPPKPDLAIKYLGRYLDLAPGEPVALAMKAKVLADTARTREEIPGAIKFVEYAARNIPEGEDRQEARRNLVRLYLRKGPFFAAQDIEYRTAVVTARELIALDAKAGRGIAGDHRLLAEALLGVDAQGDPKALAEAARELELAVKLDPSDVAGAAILADVAAGRLDQPGRADAVLDALRDAVPTALARLARYYHYAKHGPPAKARLELQEAVKAFPHDPDVLLTAAAAALEVNEVGTARAHLAALPEDGRNNYRARLIRGQVELRESRNDDAIADWRQGLLLRNGNDADLSFNLAGVLLELGRFEEARPLIDQVRRLAGGDKPGPRSRYLEALTLMKSNQPAAALAILEEIRPSVGNDLKKSLNMAIARCYEATRDEPRALLAYREAAAVPPHQADAYLKIAQLQASIAGPDAGASELAAALKTSPDNAQILLELANVRLKQRRWVDAEDLLDRVARVAPGAPALIRLQAERLIGVGQLDDAVKLLARGAQEIDRKDLSLWLAYASALARQGHVTEALQALERASGPDAAGDRAAVRMVRAQLLQQSGRGRQARQEVDRDIVALPPSDRPVLLRFRANLVNSQGDRPAALAALRQCVALTPDDPQAALALLDLAMATNDEVATNDAIKALTAIRQGDGAYEFIGRAFEALRAATVADAADRPARLDAADRLVGKVLDRAPKLPQGHLMRGHILMEQAKAREEQAKTKGLPDPARDALLDSAIVAFRAALDNGGDNAVPQLIDLLTRRRRSADMAALRHRVASNAEFDRMSIAAALRYNLRDEAQEIARKAVEGSPEDLNARRVQAEVMKRLGKPDDAEETLRELARIHPAEPKPWLQLLTLQVNRNQKAAAAATIDQIVRNVKGDKSDFYLAQAYWLAGDIEHAGEAYRKSLKAWPSDTTVVRSAIEYFEANGKSSEAEATLRRVLKDDPDAAWASCKLAVILSARTGNPAAWNEAAKLVAAPDSADDELPETRLTRAIVLSRSPDPAISTGAIPLLRSLKDDLPASTPVGREARERLIRYFLEADRPQEAWELAAGNQETDLSPVMLALHAEVLLKAKKYDEAETEIRRLEALEPKELRTEILLARLMDGRDKPEDADAALVRAYDRRAQAPDAATSAASILDALVRMGHLEAAEDLARRAAESRPGDSWMLARILALRQRPADALAACLAAVKAGSAPRAVPIAMALAVAPGANPQTLSGVDEVLEEALKPNPKAIDLLMLRAQLRHIQGRYDDEVAIYRGLQATNPADHVFLNNWAWTLSESLNKPEDALKLVQEAIRRSGRYPLYLDTEGVILGRIGKHEQAIAILTESAPGLQGGQGFLHLAEAQHHAGQDGPARRSLDQARNAGLKPETLDPEARARFKALDAALPPTPARDPKATPAKPPAQLKAKGGP